MFEMDQEQTEKLDRNKKILATYKNALAKIRMYFKFRFYLIIHYWIKK